MSQLYPLTAGQRSIALASHLYPNSPVNNLGGLVLLEDELDFDLLQKAISLCVARFDVLRLRLVRKSRITNPYAILYWDIMEQTFDDPTAVKADFVDFSGKSMDEMDSVLAAWNEWPADPFNGQIYRFTMLKAPDGRQGVFCTVDHMATDAWTCMMLAKDLIEVYYALKNGRELPTAPHSFVYSIKDDMAYLKSPQYAQDRAYWLERFRKKPHKCFVTGGKKYTATKTGKSLRYEPVLPEEEQKALTDFCRINEISLPSVFNQTMGILLAQRVGTQDVTFTIPVLMRATMREKNTCGPMVNTIADRMVIRAEQAFADACRESHTDLMSMYRHARYPYAKMLGEVLMRHLMGAFSDAYFSFQSARLRIREPVKFETKWVTSGTFASPFMLSIVDMNNTGRLHFCYECQSDAYSEQSVKDVHEKFRSILRNGICQPQVRIHSL